MKNHNNSPNAKAGQRIAYSTDNPAAAAISAHPFDSKKLNPAHMGAGAK